MHVMWAELVEPARFTGVRIASKDATGPLVVTRALVRIPWTRITGAVENQVLFRVVRDPAPHRAATNLPGIAWPTRHAQFFTLVRLVVRMKVRTDQHIGVGTRVISAPGNLPIRGVERRQPASHAEFTATITDKHLSL